ncbi:MAG: hypothetical protein EXQ63_06930, partial [Ilumatobacteraceae bacterium]|nr:hypothetical protein [Ilumatobacteraceae bacterium]
MCGENATKKKHWYLTRPLPKGFVPGLPSTKEAAYQNLLKDPSSVGGDPGIKVIVDDTEQSTGGGKVGIESKSAPTRGVIVRQPSGAINSSTLVIQPQVQLTDEANNPKLIAGIEVAVSANRADVVVTGGTATTDKKGVASFTDLALTGKTGDIELTFTPTGLVGATSDVFSVQSGKGIKFAPLVTAGNQVSGRVFNNPIKMQLVDVSGNNVTEPGVVVVATSSNKDLGGTVSVKTDANGVAVFSGLVLKAVAQTELTFSADKIESTTDSVLVVAGQYHSASIKTPPSTDALNNIALEQQPEVQLIDENGNDVLTSGVEIVVTIGSQKNSDNSVPQVVNETATTNDLGRAIFSELALKGRVGEYQISFTPKTSSEFPAATVTSETKVTLSAGVATQLVVVTSAASAAPDAQINGWSLGVQSAIALADISGNTVASAGVTVTGSSSGQETTFAALTDSAGVATFSDFVFKGDGGQRTITYSSSIKPAVSIVTQNLNLPPILTSSEPWSIPAVTTDPKTFTLTPPTSNSDGAWTYTSSNPDVATVTGDVVTVMTAGTTRITATQAATTKYGLGTSTADLAVSLMPTGATKWSIPAVTTSTNTFTLTPPTSNSDGAWTYTSSNPDVATITGDVVTVMTAGTTRITATQAATTKYGGSTSTADLAVSLMPTGATKWSIPAVTTSTNTFTLTPPTSNSDGAWSYASSDTDVATVTGDVVTVITAGTTRITATQAATTKYGLGTSTADLAVSLMPTGATKWSIPA